MKLTEEEQEASIEEANNRHQPEPITKPSLTIPNNHTTDSETETLQPKKRSLNPSLVDSTDVDELVEDKRCKVDVRIIEDDEDDWVRYSPRFEEAAVVVEEEERFISRYATDIDGDFMTVTAPDGDRVYAKLVKEESDDKVKKLEVKGPFKGQNKWFKNLVSTA